MSQLTTIILVRHADVHNPDDILYGRLPRFGLSAVGREESQRTAAALAGDPLVALYSSPQLRARQTARAIAAAHPGLKPRVTKLLAEVLTGWQGTTNSAMAARQFNFYDKPFAPGDESLAAVAERLGRWLRLMQTRHAGQTVAGVSHGDPIMVARLLCTGQAVTVDALRNQALYPPKGSLTRVEYAAGADPHALPVAVRYEDPNLDARAALEAAAGSSNGASPWSGRSHAPAAKAGARS